MQIHLIKEALPVYVIRFLDKAYRDSIYHVLISKVKEDCLIKVDPNSYFDIIVHSDNMSKDDLVELVRPYYGEVL